MVPPHNHINESKWIEHLCKSHDRLHASHKHFGRVLEHVHHHIFTVTFRFMRCGFGACRKRVGVVIVFYYKIQN